MNRALMDLHVSKIRWTALNTFVKAFRPSVPVSFVARILGFVGTVKDGHAEVNHSGLALPGCAHARFDGRYSPQVRVSWPECVQTLLCQQFIFCSCQVCPDRFSCQSVWLQKALNHTALVRGGLGLALL